MSDTKTETGRCTHSWGDIDAEGTAFYLCNSPIRKNQDGEWEHYSAALSSPVERRPAVDLGHPALGLEEGNDDSSDS